MGGEGIKAEDNGTARLCGHDVLGCVWVRCSLDNGDGLCLCVCAHLHKVFYDAGLCCNYIII